MPVRKSLFLDTNGFIYAYFFVNRPLQAQNLPDLTYYGKGESILRALEVCRGNKIRVFSTDITFLEMTHNYYEWARLRKFLEAGAPPGLIFGKNQRMDSEFLKQPLTREEQQQIISNSETWLSTWDFRDLVEFQLPERLPNWFGIAKFLNSYIHETVIDCLHLAAAISLECDFLLTEDTYLRKAAASLRDDAGCKNEIRRRFGLSEDYNLPDAVASATFNG
jgi:hypothetical protein